MVGPTVWVVFQNMNDMTAMQLIILLAAVVCMVGAIVFLEVREKIRKR